MKELPTTPGRRELCPKDCKYRAREAPFCGFCLKEYELFKAVSKIYEDAEFQFRSDWLQKQSLDVYIPSLKIGIRVFKIIEEIIYRFRQKKIEKQRKIANS